MLHSVDALRRASWRNPELEQQDHRDTSICRYYTQPNSHNPPKNGSKSSNLHSRATYRTSGHGRCRMQNATSTDGSNALPRQTTCLHAYARACTCTAYRHCTRVPGRPGRRRAKLTGWNCNLCTRYGTGSRLQSATAVKIKQIRAGADSSRYPDIRLHAVLKDKSTPKKPKMIIL